MKKFVLLVAMLFASVMYSQVGINTTAPTKTLDVNGDARIRSLPTLTSPNVSPLFSDENGVLGKETISTQSQIAFSTSTSTFPFTVSNYNTGANQLVPITSSHAVLNTIGTAVGTTGMVMINQFETYMVSASINMQLGITDDTEDRAYIAINIDVSTDGGTSWTSISGGRPIFERVSSGQINYSFTAPSVLSQLNAGNLVRLVFYRTKDAGGNLQGSPLTGVTIGSAYGAPTYTLGFTKL